MKVNIWSKNANESLCCKIKANGGHDDENF